MRWIPPDTPPIKSLCEPVEPLTEPFGHGVLLLRLSQSPVVPIVDELNRLLRVADASEALRSSQPQDCFERPALLCLPWNATLTDARRLFEQSNLPLLPVVDAEGRYSGECASRQKLLRELSRAYRPLRMGGMATPLGVYMTTGRYASGPGIPGLLLTGVCFAGFAFIVQWLVILLSYGVLSVWPGAGKFPDAIWELAQHGLMFGLLLLLLRLTPLAGLHAAEHMTINAVERGLPLRPAVVARQPRQHGRCGTNLMVVMGGLLFGFMVLENLRPWLPGVAESLFLLAWLLVLASQWRTFGRWIQLNLTTRPPTPTQLASGIRAGEDLLSQYARRPHPPPSILWRLWTSGLIPVLAGFLLANWPLERLTETLLAQLR